MSTMKFFQRFILSLLAIGGSLGLVILFNRLQLLDLKLERLPKSINEFQQHEELLTPTPTVPTAFKRFLPRESFLGGYLEVPGVDLPGIGNLYEFHSKNNISDIRAECNRFGEACKGFMYVRDPSKGKLSSKMKQYFAIPVQSEKWSLYIKKEYVHLYVNGLKTNLSCAVPLTHLKGGESGCRLPQLDPYYKEIAHLMKLLPPIKCNDNHSYTILEDNVLRIRQDIKKELESVNAKSIRRGKDDFSFTYGPTHNLNFSSRGISIQEDFWEVTSVLKNKEIKKTFHMSVVEKPDVHQRMPSKDAPDAPLDIMIITFDSTSAAHFQRMLPKTFAYLKQDMKSLLFKGYSVVGDATLPNVNALLTGRTVNENCEVKEARRGAHNAGTVDEWPFIFKDFKENGFSTLWSEDFPTWGTFTLRAKGFDEQPTDHYGRPFWLATAGFCIGGQPQVRLQLNYLKSFMQAYPGRRKFGYTFLCNLCHRRLNFMSVADLEILSFLKSLREENLLNETMFIMMGDHGPRFGDIRFTNQGKLEERLPFLSITLPEWFKEAFPNKAKNLRMNTELITSPYDLHSTFLHLMSFSTPPEEKNNTRGSSLFEALPLNRSCADAHITDQWCPCLTWHAVHTAHAHAKKAAHVAVSHVNQLLAGNNLTMSLCHRVKLKRVIQAFQKVPNAKVQDKSHEDECSYQIQFETSPADAKFEAIVRFIHTGEVFIYGTISRINAYGSQPKCIENTLPLMRKFCCCIGFTNR